VLARRFEVPIVDTTTLTVRQAAETIEDFMEAHPIFQR
jgi:hypothetical protein